MNPLGIQYLRFWREQKKRCIQGMWVSNDEGEFKFVSGPLYLYVNHWRIKLNEKNARSKTKTLGIPFLRDLEWLRSFVFEEARGFSGFQEDDEYTSHILMKDSHPDNDPELFETLLMEYGNSDLIRDSVTREAGTYKKYRSAREALYMYHDRDLGKPLYFNMAANVADMESRGGGKSYWKSLILGHNFLFDGAVDYEDYLAAKAENAPLTSETLIGAIESKYSDDLVAKVKLGLENLPGEVIIGEEAFPPPFSRKYYGSWDSGKTITAGYDKKIGGVWKKVGTFSKIQHRSFSSNHTAANGTRPNVSVIDEVGFMNNLIDVLGQMKEAAADGTVKQGVIWMTGTGGDMEGGATEEVKQVFYSPATFDCLEFDDEFEGYTTKIGFFVPAFMTLNQFKDVLGNTNWKAAVAYLERTRTTLKKNAKKKKAYEDETIQRPLCHSEVFLVANNNILPVLDLKEHMDHLLTMQDHPEILGTAGWMVADETLGGYKLKPDLEAKPADYPVQPSDDNEGAVVIWQHPNPNADYGWYVAGNDPYDFDEAPNSVSLGSVIVMERGSPFNGGYDRMVAEYTGRPPLAATFYEQVRRLLVYFHGAACLYENEKQMIKDHFKKMQSLNLLAYTPGVMKANENSKTANTRMYGQHMSAPVKAECLIYLREWLITPIGDNKMQLHTIKSIPLLKELIGYNDKGNFDRVIALMLAIIQATQMRTIVIEEATKEAEEEEEDFFTRKLFSSNLSGFRNRR